MARTTATTAAQENIPVVDPKFQEHRFRNDSGKIQIVYNESGVAIEVVPGGTCIVSKRRGAVVEGFTDLGPVDALGNPLNTKKGVKVVETTDSETK